jgi:tRNA A-37 threonylcarbamoyl transferase component Bud32
MESTHRPTAVTGRLLGRRRPSGKPPPLPHKIGASGRLWVAMLVGLALVILALFLFRIGPSIERAEVAFLRWLAEFRSDPLTSIARAVNGLGSEWFNRVLRWGTLLALMGFRRWRHFLVYLGIILVVAWLTHQLTLLITRSRPLGIEILERWDGFAFPSRPVAALGVSLTGIVYTLVVPGRPRRLAKWFMWSAIALLGAARLYLAVDHPADVAYGVILGVGIPVLTYRWLVPNAVFPVRYQRGRAAHLDLGGARGDAIRQAVSEQLGLEVVTLKPFGLAGSGGSTPMRLTIAGDPPTNLFAKLYARTHLRADRWYKLGRTILYGTLEDEKPYNSVRRLVQYEDYILRVMHDAGLPSAKSYGFVEITPEREYMLVTEFLEGGREISEPEVEVDDEVIDSGLRTVRLMWDAGIAHRDLKPANILVRDRQVFMIDPAFGEMRPSPWRQAVDLANMMVVLALRTDADRVYQRALAFFTPDEIAEAFAATRSITIPSQSRALLKRQSKEGRDILERFRHLAPAREPISIQRWSVQRIALAAGVVFFALLGVGLLLDNLASGAL